MEGLGRRQLKLGYKTGWAKSYLGAPDKGDSGTVEPTAALAKGRLGTETLVILASFPFVSHCSFHGLGRLNLIHRGKPVPALWANWQKLAAHRY